MPSARTEGLWTKTLQQCPPNKFTATRKFLSDTEVQSLASDVVAGRLTRACNTLLERLDRVHFKQDDGFGLKCWSDMKKRETQKEQCCLRTADIHPHSMSMPSGHKSCESEPLHDRHQLAAMRPGTSVAWTLQWVLELDLTLKSSQIPPPVKP